MIYQFDSIGDFIRAAEKHVDLKDTYKNGWFGNQSMKEAADCALHGDERYTASAAKWFDRFASLLPETQAYEIISAPFGSRFSIGELMADSPTAYRRRIRRTNDINPIRVVASLTSSGGIDAKHCEERGLAILALVQAIEQIRPVTLDLLVELDGRSDGFGYVVMRVETPLSLSQSAFAMCSQAFTRGIGYKYLNKVAGSYGGWPSGFSFDSAKYSPIAKQRLGMTEDDLFIPPIYLNEERRGLETWIKEKLTAVLGSLAQ